MRSLLLLTLLLTPLPGASESHEGARSIQAQELPRAVRAFYDEGAASALIAFESLLQTQDTRELRYWTARCRVALGDGPEALRLLDAREDPGSSDRSIEPWRWEGLRAQALLLTGQWHEAARVLSSSQLGGAALDDGDLGRQLRWMQVALALRAGREELAAESLGPLSGARPELDLPPSLHALLPELASFIHALLADGLKLPCDLLFRANGQDWSLAPGSSFARRIEREPSEHACERLLKSLGSCPGRPEPLRFDPQPFARGIVYAASGECLADDGDAPGIFLAMSGAGARRLLKSPPEATDESPLLFVEGSKELLFFVRRQAGASSLMRRAAGQEERLAPDLHAIARIEPMRSGLLISAVLENAPTLRLLPLDALPETPSRALFTTPVQAWSPELRCEP